MTRYFEDVSGSVLSVVVDDSVPVDSSVSGSAASNSATDSSFPADSSFADSSSFRSLVDTPLTDYTVTEGLLFTGVISLILILVFSVIMKRRWF